MQALLPTLLIAIRSVIKSTVSFEAAITRKELNVRYAPIVSLMPVLISDYISTAHISAKKTFPVKLDTLYVFTKRFNPNKLYLESTRGVFLSSGIVLRFMNQDAQRFLKKRLKVWHNYAKALKLLQKRPFIVYFKDLNGKKSIFLSKLYSSGIKVRWVFIKLFNTNGIKGGKKVRRIKRWIKKKYYQIGVNEKR